MKISSKISFLIIFVLFCNSACFSARHRTDNNENLTFNNLDSSAASVFKQQNPASSEKIQTSDEIHKVDFKNFIYQPYCAGEETRKITVENGEFSEEKQMDGYIDRTYFNVFDVSYGDLTGDGKDEAVVLTACNTGGTGNFSEGFIYGMKNGKPELLTRIEGGDRAYGGLREARVENGILIVERNDVGEAGGACCPEYIVTSKYKLEGNKLKQVGTESKRELNPAERVSFEKGKSMTVLNLNLPAESEYKRFVVGARAGQTLRVSSNSKNAQIRLYKGDADVLTEGDNLTAKLNKSGDYIFQIGNTGENNLNVSITIEIK